MKLVIAVCSRCAGHSNLPVIHCICITFYWQDDTIHYNWQADSKSDFKVFIHGYLGVPYGAGDHCHHDSSNSSSLVWHKDIKSINHDKFPQGTNWNDVDNVGKTIPCLPRRGFSTTYTYSALQNHRKYKYTFMLKNNFRFIEDVQGAVSI